MHHRNEETRVHTTMQDAYAPGTLGAWPNTLESATSAFPIFIGVLTFVSFPKMYKSVSTIFIPSKRIPTASILLLALSGCEAFTTTTTAHNSARTIRSKNIRHCRAPLELLARSNSGISIPTDLEAKTANGHLDLNKNRPNPLPTGIPPTSQIQGVIFDMDGTLLKPCIDFADMRKRVYQIADGDANLATLPEPQRRGDILELYDRFSDHGQILCKAVFDDIERKALNDMEIMENVGLLCDYLDRKGIPRAVLTRNIQKSVDLMHDKLWKEHSVREFYPAVNRETTKKEGGGPIPPKPSPDPIWYICNDVWGLRDGARNVIMVGDSAADDIVAASRAGCGGRVLLKYQGETLDNDSGGGDATSDRDREERKPSLVVNSLGELFRVLQSNE